MDVYEELVRLRNLGQKCALATIVDVRGSIPSHECAKLLVREDGSMAGTIGGGCVEAEVWNAAREVIETEKPKHLTFNLGQDAAYDNGLICGGQLDVFVECITPQPAALIFGGGHISKSLAKVLDIAGFAVSVIDNREAFANHERFPEARQVYAEEYEDVFGKLNITSSTYIVIVTRGHRDDMRVLRWAVQQPARYVGMIGSKRKTIGIFRELQKEGLDAHLFDRVHAPIGLDIGAVTPEEIAISITAELIVDNSTRGAVYYGLAIGNVVSTVSGTAVAPGTYLYLANFHTAKIEVYDTNFAPVSLDGNFTDPKVLTILMRTAARRRHSII